MAAGDRRLGNRARVWAASVALIVAGYVVSYKWAQAVYEFQYDPFGVLDEAPRSLRVFFWPLSALQDRAYLASAVGESPVEEKIGRFVTAVLRPF